MERKIWIWTFSTCIFNTQRSYQRSLSYPRLSIMVLQQTVQACHLAANKFGKFTTLVLDCFDFIFWPCKNREVKTSMNLVTFLARLVLFNLIMPYVDAKGYTRLGRTCDSLDTVERLDLTANAIFFSQKEVQQACDPDPFCSGYADLDGVFGLLNSIGSLSNILHSCKDGFEIWEKKTQTAHVSRGGEDCVDTHRYGDITSCKPFNLGREECDEIAAKVWCNEC